MKKIAVLATLVFTLTMTSGCDEMWQDDDGATDTAPGTTTDVEQSDDVGTSSSGTSQDRESDETVVREVAVEE